MTSNEKPILYLDVDGVLYYYQDRAPYAFLSPHISEFFYQIIRGQFELRMLTANPQGGKRIIQSLRHSGTSYCFIPDHVPFVYERSGFRNALPRDDWEYRKSAFINFNRPFLWIEDGISEKEMDLLREKDLLDHYYFVDNKNPDGLKNAMSWMQGHDLFDPHPDTDDNPAWRDHPQCSSIVRSVTAEG